ncbi:hypothetical protein ES703_100727 [subsurface metagenome]
MSNIFPAIIIASGLSIRKRSSFTRQLNLLAGGLKSEGWKVIIAGSSSEKEEVCLGKGVFDFPVLTYQRAKMLIQRFNARALILLGYPDQFPVLTDERKMEVPIYLWAQFSRPPDPAALGNAIPIPLTEVTKIFLTTSGFSPIGPIIPHGVDTNIFHPLPAVVKKRERNRLGLGSAFVIGAVENNSIRKKFDLLFEAFSLFLQEFKNSYLLVKTDRLKAGGGFDLEDISLRRGLSSHSLIISKELSCKEMARIYCVMDLYAHTAEWEGFGIPAIEAMACEVPVVTQPVQGPGETVPYSDLLVRESRIIMDGDTVLRWAEPQSIATVLKSAAKDPDMLNRLRARGRCAVREQFDLRVVVEKWNSLLSTCRF